MDLPAFDVLVFAPALMPAVPSGAPARVWRYWRPLTLNPYAAYAVALTLFCGPGNEAKIEMEDALGEMREGCPGVRGAWEASGMTVA